MRIIKFVVTIVFSLSAFVSAETVYKTRDAEGNIIFSDIPTEGAEKVEIREAQTLDLPMPNRTGERRTTKLSPEPIKYTKFEIVSPEHDSTVRSNEGVVTVSVKLNPELNEKHSVTFLMDGKKVSEGQSLQLSLNNIDRGSHNVIAMIKNEKDKVIKQSNKVTFHLHKASKLFKNRANNESANSNDSSATTPAPAVPATPSL